MIREHLRQLWAGLWFAPALISGTLLIFALLASNLLGWSPLFLVTETHSFDHDQAQSLLTSLAATSISVTTLLLSLTMVVLTTASSQFGPRLIPIFMMKTGTKVSIGLFVGLFAYQATVATALTHQRSVPDLAIWIGAIGSLASFIILLFFIHMVSRFIQVPHMVNEVSNSLHKALLDYISKPDQAKAASQSLPPSFQDYQSLTLASPRSGYLQRIDIPTLVKWATQNDTLITARHRAGQFIAKDEALLSTRLQDPEADDSPLRPLASSFIIGPQRSNSQDIEHAIRQLVEIAARALSPGINDFYTAINVIERLGAALREIIDDPLPKGLWYDDEQKLRLHIPLLGPAELLAAAFDPLRQNARSNEATAFSLMNLYLHLAEARPHPDFRDALRHHADLLLSDCQDTIPCEHDRDELAKLHQRTLKALS